MNLKTAKIRILDLDLKGCVYLNHFSHSHAVANFFKRISRLGDGIFWYTMLALTWLLQGLVYSLQIVYLVLGSLCGTLIYKVLKIKKGRIAVKATTNEGMGFIGRDEGICAMAVSSLKGKSK